MYVTQMNHNLNLAQEDVLSVNVTKQGVNRNCYIGVTHLEIKLASLRSPAILNRWDCRNISS